MQKLLTISTLIFFISACDAPVRTRVPTAPAYSDNVTGEGLDDPSNYEVNGNNGSTGDNGTTGDNGSGSSEPGFENCDLSVQYNGGSVGNFGLCQNTTNEAQFKAIFSQASTEGTCFVPVHVKSDGNSYKLGIAECVHNQKNTPYFMTLNKEMMPPTFSYPRPESINGVMVIKSSSVNAYMGCMNAKEDYYVSTYGCCYQKVPYNGRMYCLQPNQQCESAAANYANSVCSSFVQNHSSHYRQVSF